MVQVLLLLNNLLMLVENYYIRYYMLEYLLFIAGSLKCSFIFIFIFCFFGLYISWLCLISSEEEDVKLYRRILLLFVCGLFLSSVLSGIFSGLDKYYKERIINNNYENYENK